MVSHLPRPVTELGLKRAPWDPQPCLSMRTWTCRPLGVCAWSRRMGAVQKPWGMAQAGEAHEGFPFCLWFWAITELPDKTRLWHWKCDHLGFVFSKKPECSALAGVLAPVSERLSHTADLTSPQVIWFSRHAGVGLTGGLDDLRGLFQP